MQGEGSIHADGRQGDIPVKMRRAWTVAGGIAALILAAGALWMVLPLLNENASALREPPVPGLRNVFRAGFEEPASIEVGEEGGQAWLRGGDAYGHAWDDLDHVFQMVAPRSFGHLVTTRFSEERAHSGRRSLFMRHDVEHDGSQNRLQFFSDDTVFRGEIFTRRSYFVPSGNLDSLPGHEDAVSIAGTREIRGGSAPPGAPNADFSMPLYLVRWGDELVFSLAILDYSAGPNWSDWTRPPYGLRTYGDYTPVPLDRWFELEIYVRRDASRGEIRVWLDQEPIFVVENVRTKNDTDRWFTKLADVDAEPAPFELWVDDVEIWTR